MKDEALKWIGATVIGAAITWSTWITGAVWEDRSRLARIEAKIDILMDKVITGPSNAHP